MKAQPLVGFGKIPAPRSAAALGLTMQAGIVLLGNAAPPVTPAGATPPGQFAYWMDAGMVVVRGATAVIALPPGSVAGNTTSPAALGYMLARGTLTLNSPP